MSKDLEEVDALIARKNSMTKEAYLFELKKLKAKISEDICDAYEGMRAEEMISIAVNNIISS